MEWAYLCAPEGSEVATCIECIAEVASDAADVSAFAAFDGELEFWPSVMVDCDLINLDKARL